MKRLFGWALLAMVMLSGCAEPKVRNLELVPQPVSAELEAEGDYLLTPQTRIVAADENRNPAERFAEDMMHHLGLKQPLQIASEGEGVSLSLDATLPAEGYRMEVSATGVSIVGGSEAGLYYGLQSLRQLAVTYEGKIPYGRITDHPTFAYRGAHLDVVRHFFSVEDVKNYIDILAAHKLNRLHWHLTDDQGWRIEIKAYPELTVRSSMRKETLVGHCHRPEGYDGIPHGGFYTQEEIREVVEYAAKRYITIIPEIEMPGHAQAALHALPWLGCHEQQVEVWGNWGVTPEVMCGGKETTYEFLERVLAEVVELFPSELIHIGGDECPKERWKECEHCQARMKAEGLTTEEQLQGYLVARIERFLNAKGRRIIGWDEILEGGVTQTAAVMSWRGTEGGIYAAEHGNYAVMTPMEPCYLNFYQTESQEGEGLQIGGHNSFERVYAWQPFAGMSDEAERYILGVQCNMWTEYLTSMDAIEKMLLPRLGALSEVQWAEDRRDETTIRAKMVRMRKFYEACGWQCAPYYFDGRK